MKKAFTLIELLISIVILSILMLFLYKSYANLNKSNQSISREIQKVQRIQEIKKTLYMDFNLAFKGSIEILHQDKSTDILFMQTRYSLHKRVNPYVAYIFKDKKLYRLESLRVYKEYPLSSKADFVSDYVAEVKSFRVYKSKKSSYLIDLRVSNKEELLLKVKPLNAS